MKTFTREQVLEAYRNAPAPVQEVFTSVETAQILDDLRVQTGIHVDVAGAVGSGVGYLLLGLMTPTDFVENLRSLQLSQPIIDQIVMALNQKIFQPLRAQMKSGVVSTLPSMPAPFESLTERAAPQPPANLPGTEPYVQQSAVLPVESEPAQQFSNTAPAAPSISQLIQASPTQQTPPETITRIQPAQPQEQKAPSVLKEYGVDPYRESVE